MPIDDARTVAEQICEKIEQRIWDAVFKVKEVPSAQIKQWWIDMIADTLCVYGEQRYREGVKVSIKSSQVRRVVNRRINE